MKPPKLSTYPTKWKPEEIERVKAAAAELGIRANTFITRLVLDALDGRGPSIAPADEPQAAPAPRPPQHAKAPEPEDPAQSGSVSIFDL